MNTLSTSRMTGMLRWLANAAGLLMVIVFLMFFIGEGGFNPLKATMKESLLMICFLVACGGLVVALRNEAIGGLMAIMGMAIFFLIELISRGDIPRSLFFSIIPMIGFLHLFCFWQERVDRHLLRK
jgi:hypothetical protein